MEDRVASLAVSAVAHPEPVTLPAIRMRLIGSMQVWSSCGVDLLPASGKARALLAVVALMAPRPVLRAWLADLLWSGRPDFEARASLRQEVHRLQESLAATQASEAGGGGEILIATRDHLTFQPRSIWIDAHQVAAATTEDAAALSLLDGDLLDDLDGVDPAFDSWLTIARERLRDHARGIAEATLRARHSPEDILPAASRLLWIDRTHEGAWRAVMSAHAAMGETVQAAEAYDMCRAALSSLRDIAPSAETTDLAHDIHLSPDVKVADAAWVGVIGVGVNGVEVTGAGKFPGAVTGPIKIIRQGPWISVAPIRLTGYPDSRPGGLGDLAGKTLRAALAGTLARCMWLRVRPISDRANAKSDFILEASLATSATCLRITLRLLDARANDRVLWAQRFDRATTDLAAVEQDIAGLATALIEREMLRAETERDTSEPGEGTSAYDLMMRALPLTMRLEKPGFMRADVYLSRAIMASPDYPPPFVTSALWHVLCRGQGWSPDPEQTAAHAEALVAHTQKLNAGAARSAAVAGHVRAKLSRRPREAVAFHDRARALNPNLAIAWAFSCATSVYLGDFAAAARYYDRYKTLVPHDPLSFIAEAEMVTAKLLLGAHEDAAAAGRAIIQTTPLFADGYKPYLAALGHLGLTREAAVALARLIRIDPEFSIAGFHAATPLCDEKDRAHFANGLRLAGVP